MTEADLLDALRDCYHPLLRRNLVELQMVRGVSVRKDDAAPGAGIPGVPERYIAKIAVTAPGSDDVQNAQMKAQIENRLLGMQAVSRAEVTLLPALFPIL